MEHLSPALTVLLQIRWEMENGSSLRESVQTYLRQCSDGEFDRTLREWSVRKSHGQSARCCLESTRSPYRRALLDLFERGWAGEPVLKAFEALEKEIELACDAELDHFVLSLPFRAMLPLLFLHLPAYLMLLLGPILSDLTRSLGGSS
jgi:hypothetical protein